jgi:hypothetical protein
VDNQSSSGSTTLIVYGDLPAFRESEAHDAKILFDGKLNHRNRRSFEPLLLRELAGLMGRDLRGATVRPLRTIAELSRFLKARNFSTVVFYGHTISMLTSGPAENRQDLALAGPGMYVTPREYANTLRSAGIHETMIAGCASVSFAAGVFAVDSSIRAGGLYLDRHDVAKGNDRSVMDFRIERQTIKWWSRNY